MSVIYSWTLSSAVYTSWPIFRSISRSQLTTLDHCRYHVTRANKLPNWLKPKNRTHFQPNFFSHMFVLRVLFAIWCHGSAFKGLDRGLAVISIYGSENSSKWKLQLDKLREFNLVFEIILIYINFVKPCVTATQFENSCLQKFPWIWRKKR